MSWTRPEMHMENVCAVRKGGTVLNSSIFFRPLIIATVLLLLEETACSLGFLRKSWFFSVVD